MEQATLLLWRNFVIYSLESSWTCIQNSEFLRVVYQSSLYQSSLYQSPFWYTLPEKNMLKVVDNKEMFQECYLGVFIINLENLFDVCDGVWFS